MLPLLHLPLEKYQSRYTELLADWETEAFVKAKFKPTKIEPKEDSAVLNIITGEVLDSIQRPRYAMAQMMELLARPDFDFGPIYFSDFFHPGLEALPYSRRSFKAFSFLWAQTFDQYDFTTRMVEWMRPWEVMAFDIYSLVFVAHPVLKDLIVSAIPNARVEVVGLPYNSTSVSKLWDKSFLPSEEYDVVYTSRWDYEKDPSVFVSLVDSRPDLSFAICTGLPELKGSDVGAIQAIQRLAQTRQNIRIYTNLSKGQYYSVLARSKVQFNCAMQDWVSFTLLDALTYNCRPLYPCFRSFPDTLCYSFNNLYAPGSSTDANKKLDRLLSEPVNKDLRWRILQLHDSALDSIAQIMRNA
jgi:glycosyltransferase involved in cell wall biosynthesis